MAVNFRGYVFDDSGSAVSGATVQLLETGTTTEEASTTTNSDGLWSFSESDQDRYDVKVTSGSSLRYRNWDDQISLKEIDIRNNTAATTPALTATNLTNSASNQVAIFRGANSTRADGDEIYLSFELADDGGNLHEFARITAEAVDVSNASEDGQIRFGVSVGGTITDVFTINATTAGATDMTLDVSGDLTLDADGGDVFFKDGGTTFGSATNNSGNLIIKSGTTTALTFSGADVTVAGDVTISGDDLKMATNTDTYILVADGTSYNPVAISGDVTIANDGAVTIANDAVESGMLNDNVISGQTELASGGIAAADEIAISDGGTLKKIGVDNLIIDSPALVTEAAIANGDYVLFLDGGATGSTKKEALADVATLFAGTGISASASVLSLDAAQTGITSLLATDIKIGEDDQTKIDFETADEIHFYAANVHEVSLVANVLQPATSDGIALGTGSLMWSDLFLASGAVVNFNNGDVTLTHASNTLTVAGGTLATAALTTSTIVASAIIKTDDATDATSTTDGSLQTDGGLSVEKDAIFGNDIKLLSDSAVFNMGAGSDFTITHDGTTGATIAGNPLTMDSAADITLDAGGADIILKDDGTQYGALTNSSATMLLKGHVYHLQVMVFNAATDCSTGDAKYTFLVPASLNGAELVTIEQFWKLAVSP